MDIKTEKETVIHQLEQVEDMQLLMTIKQMLDYGLKKQSGDRAFSDAMARALEQSANGEGRSNEEVKKDIYQRFSA